MTTRFAPPSRSLSRLADRLARSVLGCLALSALGSGAACAVEAVFFLHSTRATFSACAALDVASLRCASVSPAASSTDDQFVWVLVGDVRGEVGGAQLGIAYDASVNVQHWSLCTGGSEIRTGTSGNCPNCPFWPASGAGIAVTWNGACYRTSSNDMAKVGLFLVGAGSSGRMRIAQHPDVSGRVPNATTPCNPQGVEEEEACPYNGSLVIGGGQGYLPEGCRCSGPPVLESSWATIKNQYR